MAKRLTLNGLDGHKKAILFEVVLKRGCGVVLESKPTKQVSSLGLCNFERALTRPPWNLG